MADLPLLALSVRQPWAWAIFNGKDIENRDWKPTNPGLRFRGPVAIHAATGMTQDEYINAADFIFDITGKPIPGPADLARGAIIGSAEVADIVREHTSPWYMGAHGIVLRAAAPCDPIPCTGALGFFPWRGRQQGATIASPARWMRSAPMRGLGPFA